ncbi:hypothetical protein T35B1_14120 [Salinisphaera shabanensis T35B1]
MPGGGFRNHKIDVGRAPGPVPVGQEPTAYGDLRCAYIGAVARTPRQVGRARKTQRRNAGIGSRQEQALYAAVVASGLVKIELLVTLAGEREFF